MDGKDSDQSSNYSLRGQKRKREESESEESIEESTRGLEKQDQESNLKQIDSGYESGSEKSNEESNKEVENQEDCNLKQENSGESKTGESIEESNKEVENQEESNPEVYRKQENSSGESKEEPREPIATLIDESEIGQDADPNQENSSEGSDSNNSDSDSEEPTLMAKIQMAIQTMQGWSLNDYGIFGCILGIVIGFGIYLLAVITNIESFPCPSATIDDIMHAILDKIIELQLQLL